MKGTAVSCTIRREYQMAGQTDNHLGALQQMDLRKGHQRAVERWDSRRGVRRSMARQKGLYEGIQAASGTEGRSTRAFGELGQVRGFSHRYSNEIDSEVQTDGLAGRELS